jgi:hypothetical protein
MYLHFLTQQLFEIFHYQRLHFYIDYFSGPWKLNLGYNNNFLIISYILEIYMYDFSVKKIIKIC